MTFYQLSAVPSPLQEGCLAKLMLDGDHEAFDGLIRRWRNNGTLFDQLLIEKKNFGSSAFHLAVFQNCLDSARVLLDGLADQREKLELLTLKSDKQQISALHQAAEKKACLRILSLFIETISVAENCYELLKTLCGTGRTILHCAIQHQNIQGVHMILNAVPQDKRLEYITSIHGQYETASAIHCAASSSDPEMMNILLSYLENDESSAALVSKDKSQKNILHLALESNPNPEKMIEFVWDRLDRVHFQMILWETDKEGLSPLHTAATKGYLTCVELLLRNLTVEEQFKALTHKYKNMTVANGLHACFRHSTGNRQIKMTLLLEFLNKMSFHLQSIDSNDGIIQRVLQATKYELRMNTTRDMIKGVSPWELLMQRSKESAVEYLTTLTDRDEMLGLLQHKSVLDNRKTLLHSAAQAAALDQVRTILDLAGQTMRSSLLNIRDARKRYPIQLAKNNEVKRLLEWSKKQEGHYYLPTPPAVLIIYNTGERDGADDEMISIAAVMPKFGLMPTIQKNRTEEQILDAIREICQKEGAGISGLIVVMMSHGEQGAILDCNGKALPIQDIINQMNPPFLDGKPKVLVLQCCQNNTRRNFIAREDHDWRRGKSWSSKPVRPRRKIDAMPVAAASSTTTSATATTSVTALPSATASSTSPIASTGYSTNSWPRRAQPHRFPDHFDLPKADMSLLMSTVGGGLAERNVFIPLLAKQLQESAESDDINDVFLKTHREMEKQIPDQIPVYMSTMKYKLNLRMIFKKNRRSSTFGDLSGCPVQ